MKGKKGLIGAAVLLAVLGWTIYQRQGVPILDEDTKNRLTCVLDYRNGIYAEWKGKGYVSHGSGYQDLQGGVFGEQDVTERVDRERLLDLLAVHQRRRGRFEKSDRIFIDGAQIEICGENEDGRFGVLLGERSAFYQEKGNNVYQYWIFDDGGILTEILEMIDG
ncbi:MAG: hypothetical protein HFE61_03575 [Anaerotignum sp.]|jgi:hypothetical protein|nr:hypothetical protein [Anaerotignum sp.]